MSADSAQGAPGGRMPVRVAIVGCGQIGARWDMPGAAATGGPSLTHAAAFSRHPLARIVAFCDAEPGRAEQAVAGWGCGTAYADVGRMLAAAGPLDLVVLATHSTVRSALVEPVLAAGVRTLVIEKPLADTLDEARRLHRTIAAQGAVALVNYLRHWDPALAELRQQLAAGRLGRLQRLVGLYGKGLANNGSHLIDLAGLLCQAWPVRARQLGSPLPPSESDWSGGTDPAVDAQVQLAGAPGETVQLDLLATDGSAFTCFELKLIGSAGICEIRLGGRSIEWLPVVSDPNFAGYRVPGERTISVSHSLPAMDRMAAEAVALARRERSAASCDARRAVAVAATVDAIRRSGGEWISIDE